MQETRLVQTTETHRMLVTGKGYQDVKRAIEFTAYRSRWGWHPISLEDFRILRAVYKRYWETLRAAYQWARWFRKEPQNRVISEKLYHESGPNAGSPRGRFIVGEWEEPTVDPLFIEKLGPGKGSFEFYTPRPCGFSRGHILPFRPLFGAPAPRWSERHGDERSVILDFQRARKPVEDPQQLAPLDMTPYRAVWDAMMAGAV